MKKICIIFLVFVQFQAFAQNSLKIMHPSTSIYFYSDSSYSQATPNPEFLKIPKNNQLVTINTFDSNFQNSFLINEKGETISRGHMPSSYYMPNGNPLVISGRTSVKDSFNPYGASDVISMLFYGSCNTFISFLKKNKKK